MALRSWQVLQNENLPIRTGKNTDTVKADLPKPLKPGLQDRKALRDVSNTGKPLVPAKSKGSVLRDLSNTGKPSIPAQLKGSALNKSVIRVPEIKSASKCSFLTEDEVMKCEEWAKEGIELVHFTGNDLQKFKEVGKEERIRKKAQKVISSLRAWSNATYDLFPGAEASEVIDVVKMEMVPEVVLPLVENKLLISGNDDDLLEVDADQLPFLDCALELKLKDEASF